MSYGNFQKIIENYYHELKTKRVPPPKKIIKKKIYVEKPETIDTGGKLKRTSILILFLGVLVSVLLKFSPAGIFMLLAAVISFIILFRKSQDSEKVITRKIEKIIEEEVDDGEERIVEIPNTEKIIRLKKSFIPFWIVPLDKYAIMTGPIELTRNEKIIFPTLSNFHEVYKIIEKMNEIKEKVPYILDGEKNYFKLDEETLHGNEIVLRGYEKNLAEFLEDLKELTQDINELKFSIPLVNANEFLPYLKRISNDVITDTLAQVISDYINSEEGLALEKSLKTWISDWEFNKSVLDHVRFTSLSDQVAPISLDLSNALNYSAFNFYCPECNKDKAENLINRDYSLQMDTINEPIYFSKNTRCLFNPETKLWRCKTCNKEFEHPIPVHKSYDEILMPTFIRLMDENKNERLKAHKDVKNREIEYDNQFETEMEKISYENITTMLNLTDEMERMRSEIAGEVEAVNSFREIISLYSIHQSTVISNINQFCEQVNNEIAERTKEVIARVDYIKQSEMEQLNEKLTTLARAKKKEEEIRDAVQREILQNTFAQIAVMQNGFSNMSEKLNSIDSNIMEGNKIAKESAATLSELKTSSAQIAKHTAKANAIQAAIAKKHQIELHDESFLLHPIKKINHAKKDILGSLLGKSTVEIEGGKINE